MSAVMEEEIKRWTALARPSASYVVSVRWVCPAADVDVDPLGVRIARVAGAVGADGATSPHL